MSQPHPAQPKRRAQGRRRHSLGHTLLSVFLSVLLVVGLYSVYAVRSINDGINVASGVEDQLGDNRPTKVEQPGDRQPINVLVMGTDTRDGAGNNIDGLTETGNRSDTTILMHLSADRERAYGISIPA